MLSPSIFLLALLIHAFYACAHPIGSNSTTMSHLERRIKPGSYSIMTPAKDMVIYDPEAKSFCIFVKFGDGDKTGRMDHYGTHNPSWELNYRVSRKKGQGGKMQLAILVPLSDKFIGIEQVKNHNDGGIYSTFDYYYRDLSYAPIDTEWFRLDLGQDRSKAIAGKAALRKKMQDYEKHTDVKGYATQFNELVKEHTGNKPPTEGSDTPSTPKKNNTPESMPKKDNTPSTPKKGNTPSTPKKGWKTPKLPKKAGLRRNSRD
ncbi:hypothetical protein C0995_014021 [Termitomyces sp. Mi166|nr:hypothetical protein C0995_014021 [Termitomyces sp. Mi166\